MFWKCQVGYNTDGLGGFEYSAVRCEPAHDTAGFKLLYKYQEKNHLTDREVYTLRDFKTDDYKEADQILADFFREIENVFKAKSEEELLDHFDFVHKDASNPLPKISDFLIKYQGEVISANSG